jgi:molybdate transport system regulatory protein
MVNASSVMLAQERGAPRISARNKIAGKVVNRVDDGADSEVAIDIGGGKTLTAVVTSAGADPLGLRWRASPRDLQDLACHPGK